MAEDNIVQRIKRWKPMSKRPNGRHKKRWEDDILEDIKNMNVRNWPYTYRGFIPTNVYKKEEIHDILGSG